MRLFRRLHASALLRARGRAPSAETDELSESEAFGILVRAALALLRGLVLRARLRACGGRLFVARNVRVTSAGRIAVGRNVKLEELVELQGLARRGITLGDDVTIGRCASIRPSSYYGIDLGEGLSIGSGSAIGAHAWIGASGFVEIGRNVLCGPRVSILPENHVFDDVHRPIKEQGVVRDGVVIEDDCWIGANVSILAGVRIGRGSIVAAGAVVTKNVLPGCIVGGVPARILRSRDAPARAVRAPEVSEARSA